MSHEMHGLILFLKDAAMFIGVVAVGAMAGCLVEWLEERDDGDAKKDE